MSPMIITMIITMTIINDKNAEKKRNKTGKIIHAVCPEHHIIWP